MSLWPKSTSRRRSAIGCQRPVLNSIQDAIPYTRVTTSVVRDLLKERITPKKEQLSAISMTQPSQRASFGKQAEDFVAVYIAQHGWKVLEKNHHSRFGEIDLIAQDGNELVFIEVKARKNASFGSPVEAVTEGKLEKMVKTIHMYLLGKQWEERPWRVDVFAVYEKDGSFVLGYYKNFG